MGSIQSRSLIMLLVCVLSLGPLVSTALCLDLTKENYDKITTGMKEAEVEKLLGGPGNELASTDKGKSMIWSEKDRHIHIVFAKNRTKEWTVLSKSKSGY